MKKKFFPLTTLFLILIGYTSVAQPVTTDALTFSQTREGFATARATAMGGAIASLGADISSLSYNPAGLAMYRNSEFVFVPQILSVRTNATYGGVNNINSALARFNASVGGVAYFGNDFSKHKFSLGFVYNRLKDFRGQYTIDAADQTSVTNLYADQLNKYPGGIDGNTLFNSNAIYRYPAQYTNAILAFQSGAVDTLNPANPTKYIPKMNGTVRSNAIMNTSGYIDEYDFSAGYSYDDRLFLGLTIGLQSMYYYQNIDYLEIDNDRNETDQTNELVSSGFGVNFKLGVAYKVTDNLRLGFAFHTPTFYSIKQNNAVSIYNNNSQIFSSPNSWGFSFNTPWKFIAGASYNILKRLTISADYQATLYNTARFLNYPGVNELNTGITGITKSFQNVSNVRVGLEWNALQWKSAYSTNFLFLRAGYNFISSPFTKTTGLNSLEQYNMYTAGIGYKGRIFFADFAFSYADAKNLPWNMPNGYELNPNNGLVSKDIANINPTTRTMNFMLTIGFRF